MASCDNGAPPNSCSGGTGGGTCWIEPFQRFPSLTGSSTEIYDYSSSDNALFIKKLAPSTDLTLFNGATTVTFYYSMKVDPSVVQNGNAIEFDVFQFHSDTNGSIYRLMMGTQCDITSNNEQWDFWDQAANPPSWFHSPYPCSNILDGNWHHVILYATMNHSTGQESYTFVSLTVDGTTTELNPPNGYTFDAPTTVPAANLGVQFQIDVTAAGNGYHEWFDDVRLCLLPNSQCPAQ